MVKIRLKRLGTKGRPFYRIVVAPSTSGRNGKVVENIGTYDPLTQPHTVVLKEDRALHWLQQGAQPTETTAYLLNKAGILPKFLEERPSLKKQYGFLDKRTEVMAVKSTLDTPAPVAVEEKVEAVAEEAPVVEEAPAAAETTE